MNVKRRYWIILISAALLAWVVNADAKCRVQWVDHDHDAFTPAVRMQICDRITDLPAIPKPSVRPIQKPQVRPIRYPTVPPIGTQRCRLVSVLDDELGWITRTVCK